MVGRLGLDLETRIRLAGIAFEIVNGLDKPSYLIKYWQLRYNHEEHDEVLRLVRLCEAD